VFEVATGVHPFMDGPASDYLNRLRSGALNEAALGRVDNPCVVAVLRRLLRPNPHERFRDAGRARQAMRECVG
jgi:hypothetical protein